jgi:hypothetical protein
MSKHVAVFLYGSTECTETFAVYIINIGVNVFHVLSFRRNPTVCSVVL